MRKRIKVKQLGKKKSHRDLMFRNQIRDLIIHGRLVTTTPKAKELKKRMQKLLAKIASTDDKLVVRRTLSPILKDKRLIDKFIAYTSKEGYAVTTVRVGYRDGDNAQMTRVTLLNYEK